MIISASRRTDLPAFFSVWFMHRIKKQYCTVANPFNSKQVTSISLRPADVDAIVFWTKNAKPLLPHLSELTARGYQYYFQYTVTGYGAPLEAKVPVLAETVETFAKLAAILGKERIVWRYDPIIISNKTSFAYHQEKFALLAEKLAPYTQQVVISIVDDYRKAAAKLRKLQKAGIIIAHSKDSAEIGDLLSALVQTAQQAGLTISSCAEKLALQPYGIRPGKCIDEQLLNKLFSLHLSLGKDRGQRQECGCVVSKDIGRYDTCRYDCAYCYAGRARLPAQQSWRHDMYADSL